jgi:hypothetical protein
MFVTRGIRTILLAGMIVVIGAPIATASVICSGCDGSTEEINDILDIDCDNSMCGGSKPDEFELEVYVYDVCVDGNGQEVSRTVCDVYTKTTCGYSSGCR